MAMSSPTPVATCRIGRIRDAKTTAAVSDTIGSNNSAEIDEKNFIAPEQSKSTIKSTSSVHGYDLALKPQRLRSRRTEACYASARQPDRSKLELDHFSRWYASNLLRSKLRLRSASFSSQLWAEVTVDHQSISEHHKKIETTRNRPESPPPAFALDRALFRTLGAETRRASSFVEGRMTKAAPMPETRRLKKQSF